LSSAQADNGVAAANISVVQHDLENTTNSVTVTTTLSLNGFNVRDGSSLGDYNVQIGSGSSDDVDTGVLLTSVAENGRDNLHWNYPGTNFCTSAMAYSRSGANAGAYWIPSFNAPTGAEYNINVSAAFFSYSNWLGGFARNSGDTNGGANNLFTGSPGLVLGTHFVDNGSGVSTVDLTSLGIDSRTNGVLLVTYGDNEDNYATSQVNNDGTWTVYVKDSGANGSVNEQDPVAFVFIPETNLTVISGRFQGDGTILMPGGATPLFTVTNTSTGTWRLTIPGHSPAGGVLILSAEGGLSQNQDNIVSYQPDGDGWIIQSRDLPGSPPSLQTPTTQPVASFVFIPATGSAALIAPPENAQDMGGSVTLSVAVSNVAPGDLSLTFYGHEAPTPYPGPDFCMVVMPDTQNYTAQNNGGTKAMMIAQTEWAVSNRLSRNVAYVTQLGDISNNGDSPSYISQWYNATNAMYRLENPVRTQLKDGVAYGVAVGNHEQSPNGDATSGTTSNYNRYFGVSHFTGYGYYAGHYGTNNNNHFDFFSVSGLDFVVLYFEYDTSPPAEVLAWANDVLRTNAHRRAIAVTHYMGTAATPSSFSTQGKAIYNALKTNANLFLLLGGHVCGSTGEGEGSRTDTYNGNTIRTLISDYQCRTNGGNGIMRIMEFSPSNNVVTVQTYSPWTDEYETDEDSEFFFTYNMQTGGGGSDGTPCVALATNTGVGPGSVTSITWSGLRHNTSYEWYVVVTDASGNTTKGPAWHFTTGPNSAPVANNQLVTVPGDAPASWSLYTSDPNDDLLTLIMDTQPVNGVVLGFNPTNRLLTYLPARGFRGLERFNYHVSDGELNSKAATMSINVASPADTDANGLPDAWEAYYGVSDAAADDDGDGQNNLQEYRANTNPTNATSALRILSFSELPGGQSSCSWSTVGGTRYRVQFANSDAYGALPAAFTDITRAFTNEIDASPWGTASTQSFTDDFTLTGGPPTNGARYYRIRIFP